MESATLANLLKDKNEQGLVYLYDHYAAALNGIILRIVGSEKIAEDVLQQTFLKIWEKIDTYDKEKASLFTWMSRIARNKAIDTRKLKGFKQSQKTDSLEKIEPYSKTTTTGDAHIDVTTLINKIDKKYKTVLECVYLEGHSHSEAAKKLELPIGTVKTRLRKAIKELQIMLNDEKHLFLTVSIFILIAIYLVLCQ